MLDAIRQQIAIETTSKLTAVPPPNPEGGRNGAFDQVILTPAEPEPVEAVAPDRQRDRGELGEGWDAGDPMEIDRYEDPAVAAAAEPAEPAAESTALSAEERAEPAPSETVGAPAAEAGAEAPGMADAAAAEQVARNAALLEQLGSGVTTGPPVDAASEQVAAETAAELGVMLGGTPSTGSEGGKAQAALDANVASRQAATAIDSELPVELTVGRQVDASEEAVAPRTDEPSRNPTREATTLTETAGQGPQVAGDDDSASTRAARSTEGRSESPQSVTMAEPIVAAVDPGAGGESADGQSAAGEGFAARVSIDPAGANPPEGPATAPAEEPPAPNIDQLAARTVRWRHLGLLGSGGSARIRLDPPSLGSVEVMLRTDGNTVRVELTVESEAVRQLLTSNSDRLAQALGGHGLQAGRIEVTVQTPGESSTETASDGQQAEGQSPRDGGGGDDDGAFEQEIEDQLNLTV